MNSVKLEKLSASILKLSSDATMEYAEKLYTKGLISYPRTETDFFDKSIDIKQLVTA